MAFQSELSEPCESIFCHKELPFETFPLYESIRRQGKLCDVTLCVGESRFHAHRVVLAATIPYFYAMFTHDMAEAKQKEITIHGIDSDALESLITFVYSGKIRLTEGNVESILIGACFLNIASVRDACASFLRKRLSVLNCLSMKNLAERLGCTELISKANKFIEKHFNELRVGDHFNDLPFEDICEIVKSDNLLVKGEEQVFEAVMKWIKCDEESRAKHLPDLLVHVRLPLTQPKFLTDVVLKEQLVKNNLTCRDLVDEAKDFYLLPERSSCLRSFSVSPRCGADFTGLIFAVGGLTSAGESLNTVECYDPIKCKWHPVLSMRSLRSRVGVSVLKNELYAIGGYDGNDRLNTVEVYNIQCQAWKPIAPMHWQRSALGSGVMEGNLFVCGGYDGVASLNSVEMYNPDHESWRTVANMLKHRSAGGVAVLRQQLYALGGHDGLSIFDSVETYNSECDKWLNTYSMLTKRCRLGVSYLGGRIYACGGYDGSAFLSSVEAFDPLTGRWSYVAPMNVKRSRVALVCNGGKLYAVGGYDGARTLNSVEIYEPRNNTWQFTTSMNNHEGGVGVGVLPLNFGFID